MLVTDSLYEWLYTWDHEEDVLSLLETTSPLPVQGNHHKHQSLAVEWDPADEEGNHYRNWKNGMVVIVYSLNISYPAFW